MIYRKAFASLNAGVEYLEIPKVACTAIKAALLETDGHTPRDGGHAHCHRHFEQIPLDWEPEMVFTFVRHPLDRLVSAYVEKLQKGLAHRLGGGCPLPPSASFLEWCRWIDRQNPRHLDRHWLSQSLVLERRAKQPDVILKFEELPQAWNLIRTRFPPLKPLAVWNKSDGKRPWQTYYCEESLAIAMRVFRGDMDRWAYAPPEEIPCRTDG